MKRSAKFIFSAVVVSLSLVAGCRSLTISISDSNPPVITFSASRFAECCRQLDFLGVYEVPLENQKIAKSASTPKENIILWQIWPNAGTDNSADGLPPITYGKVPLGFTQKIPTQGEPPPLVEGKIYEAGGPPISVPDAYMRFTIRNGKAVRLPIAW
jgi:hypothetical protein